MDPNIQKTKSLSRELSFAPHSAEIAPSGWISSDPFTLPVRGVETFALDRLPSAPPSAEIHFIASQPRTSYGPIPDRRSAPRASLDPNGSLTQDSDGSLRVSRGPRKNRISTYYHVHPRPLDIPKLDYGLPDDFGEFKRLPIVADSADIFDACTVPDTVQIASEGTGSDLEFNDFASIIPLDCPTSTPVASRKRVLEKPWPASRVALPTHGPSPNEVVKLLSEQVPLGPLG
jgi:hypothetical protein